MRQLLDHPSSPAPRRGSRILLLTVLCGVLTLAQGVAQLPKTPPAPQLSTGCTSSAQCLPGQICCPACGQPDCGNRCFVPVKGHCPLFV